MSYASTYAHDALTFAGKLPVELSPLNRWRGFCMVRSQQGIFLCLSDGCGHSRIIRALSVERAMRELEEELQ